MTVLDSLSQGEVHTLEALIMLVIQGDRETSSGELVHDIFQLHV